MKFGLENGEGRRKVFDCPLVAVGAKIDVCSRRRCRRHHRQCGARLCGARLKDTTTTRADGVSAEAGEEGGGGVGEGW